MQLKKLTKGTVIRLDRGESVIDTLSRGLREAQIFSGMLMGIGALKNIELGFFDLLKKEYNKIYLKGIYELLSFTGNITCVENNPFIHAHAVLGSPHYQTVGGHFFNAEVAVTMEVFIFPLSPHITRTKDPFTGLKLWHWDQNETTEK